MNAYASDIVSYLFAQSWQIALVAAMVGLIVFALRNHSAHLRYLLWLIVLTKCLVPPFLTIPLAVLPEQPARLSGILVDLAEDRFALEPRAVVESDPAVHESTPAMPGTREWMVLGWLAGVLIFLLWVGGRAVRYAAWLHGRRRPLPPDVREFVQGLSLVFRFRRWPGIWLVEGIGQPFVWGLLRGSVYLPAGFINLRGSDGRRSILAHELSHVARFDAGVNLLQVLAQAVYWFHPFVWWANRRIRQEREKCCEEMAVARLRTPPERYTGAIVDALAAERRSAHPIPSLAIVGSVRDIEERIKTMLTPGKTFRTRPSLMAATVASLIALVTIPTALVLTARAQTPTTQPGANAENVQPARYAARTFNSKVALDVFVRGTGAPDETGSSTRLIGSTPSATPLEIPACDHWHVQSSSPVQDWALLAREISKNTVPGLLLTSATDSDLPHLAGLNELEDLGLSRTQITDAGLVYLKGLSGLSWLNLAQTQITDTGLQYLEGLIGLRRLFLNGTQVTDTGLTRLEGLTGLWDLGLSNTKISDAGLSHLKALASLKLLDLAGTGITDAGIEHLSGLPALQILYLRDTAITDAGLRHLEGIKTLRELDLIGTRVTDAGLAHLKGLTDLGTLYVCDLPITDAGLECLKGLTQWQWLDLSGTQVTDAGMAYLKGATRLERLDVRHTRVGDAGLEHIKNLAMLRDLVLAGTKITDAGLVHIKGMTALQFVILSHTQVTDAGLADLKGLMDLRRLHLTNTQTTDTGLEPLKGLTKLRELRIEYTQVTDAAVQRLKRSLPNLVIVRERSQRATRAADGSSAAGGQPEQPPYAARTFNSKAYLDVWVQETSELWSMRRIGSTPSGAPLEIPACWLWGVRLKGPVNDWDLLRREMNQNEVPGLAARNAVDSDLRQLAGLKGLRSLDLSYSKITDAGLEYLKDMSRLEQLNLRETGITDAGLEHLAMLTGLQELRLGNAQITDAGLKHLKDLAGLQVLGLGRTRITDAGLGELKALTGLRQLIVPLGRNQVTDAGVQQLQQALPNLTIQRAPLGVN